jgi:hypothetical protein
MTHTTTVGGGSASGLSGTNVWGGPVGDGVKFAPRTLVHLEDEAASIGARRACVCNHSPSVMSQVLAIIIYQHAFARSSVGSRMN